jgi:phenylpyruvate tautomerase PptA (4-oxalocrotonate tautomerase family)
MPIIHIEALPPREDLDIHAMCEKVSERVAAIMGIPARQVWTIWRPIEPGQYLEGDVAADLQPFDTHPPIVNIEAYEGRPPEMIAAVLKTVAQMLAKHLGIEAGNAFVTYTEIRAGRVYTGGEVR